MIRNIGGAYHTKRTLYVSRKDKTPVQNMNRKRVENVNGNNIRHIYFRYTVLI